MEDQGSQDQGSNPQEPTTPAVEGWSIYHQIIREVPLSPHFKRQILSMRYLFKTHNLDIMPFISNAELTFPPRPAITPPHPFLKTYCLLKSQTLETSLASTNVLISFCIPSFLNFSTGFLMGPWFSSITFEYTLQINLPKVQFQLCHSSFKRKVLMDY